MFIWDCVGLCVQAVLVHRQSVKSIEWCPSHSVCAIATGNNRLYLWSEDGASLCDLPFGKGYLEREMAVGKLTWSRSGQFLVVKEKGNLVVAYPQFDDIAE